jgi:hypothetical protein
MRQRTLVQAIFCNGSARPRRCAVVRAVVVVMMLEDTSIPLDGLTVVGLKLHVSPISSVPQENITVPG